jgi:hypothetical protein
VVPTGFSALLRTVPHIIVTLGCEFLILILSHHAFNMVPFPARVRITADPLEFNVFHILDVSSMARLTDLIVLFMRWFLGQITHFINNWSLIWNSWDRWYLSRSNHLIYIRYDHMVRLLALIVFARWSHCKGHSVTLGRNLSRGTSSTRLYFGVPTLSEWVSRHLLSYGRNLRPLGDVLLDFSSHANITPIPAILVPLRRRVTLLNHLISVMNVLIIVQTREPS